MSTYNKISSDLKRRCFEMPHAPHSKQINHGKIFLYWLSAGGCFSVSAVENYLKKSRE